MGMMVSMRIESSKRSQGQAGHDFDDRPGYADAEKKELNKTIVGGTYAEIKSLIDSQSRSIIERFNEHAAARRKQAKTPQERRKIGSWRRNTATHKKAIITFSSEFSVKQDQINRDELDKCAKDFFTKFCEERHCELTYIVRHEDESTPHYHAMFTNLAEYEDTGTEDTLLNTKKKNDIAIDKKTKIVKPIKFEMRHLSALQDQIGLAFSGMGISRGKKRNERLEIARENNPKKENETDDDYKKRTYKLANVMHKSVAQLHEEMPSDLAKKQAMIDALKNEISIINQKFEKASKNLENAQHKLKNTVVRDEQVTEKIEKNIRTYERREARLSAELAEAERKLSELTAHSFDLKTFVRTVNVIDDNAKQPKFGKPKTKKIKVILEKDIEIITDRLNCDSKKNKLDKKENKLDKKKNENRALELDEAVKNEENRIFQMAMELRQRDADAEIEMIERRVRQQVEMIAQRAVFTDEHKLTPEQLAFYETPTGKNVLNVIQQGAELSIKKIKRAHYDVNDDPDFSM